MGLGGALEVEKEVWKLTIICDDRIRRYAQVRLFFGAALSTFDTATDMYMIYEFYEAGAANYARATIYSLVANVVYQLLWVWFQNRKKKKKGKMLREMAFVLCFVKPGVDVWRVASDTEEEEGSLVDPKLEMMFTKGGELLCEAIPGTLIQMYAYLQGGDRSNAAAFSLIVSVFTAAFTSAGVSFDFDVRKDPREIEPSFFGYVPDGTKGKVWMFFLLFVMSATQLFTKAFACALCALSNRGGDSSLAS